MYMFLCKINTQIFQFYECTVDSCLSDIVYQSVRFCCRKAKYTRGTDIPAFKLSGRHFLPIVDVGDSHNIK